jgi:hypothetical protein
LELVARGTDRVVAYACGRCEVVADSLEAARKCCGAWTCSDCGRRTGDACEQCADCRAKLCDAQIQVRR